MKFVSTGVLLSALVLAANASPAFAQEGIAGQWELTLQTSLASVIRMDLALDGDKVSGTLTSETGSTPVAGTFSGGNLVARTSIEIADTVFPVELRGTLAAGVLAGTAKGGSFGELPFTAKRPGSGADPAANVAPDATAGKSSPSGGVAADVSGKWDVVLILTGMGEFPLTATLNQDGTSVTGTLVSIAGQVPVSGTMTGSSLKIDFTTQTPQGPLPITLTGELAGDQLTGKASVAGLGGADWKATRGK